MTELLSILIGFFFHYILEWLGMRSLQDGVDYYAEVHQSMWNSIIHTIFMPFTMFGMFLWVPALFRLNPSDAFSIRKSACLFYISHYVRINRTITIGVCTLYTIPYVYSHYWYTYLHYYKKPIILYGLGISIASLLVQEFAGHYLGGDPPSRFEGIPNAIIYAPYYSFSHVFQ